MAGAMTGKFYPKYMKHLIQAAAACCTFGFWPVTRAVNPRIPVEGRTPRDEVWVRVWWLHCCCSVLTMITSSLTVSQGMS